MKVRIQIDPPRDNRWKEYPETVEHINSVWGDISKYGTKQMPDGRVWVIHGMTGKPMERHKAVPVSQDGHGNVIYLLPGEKLRPHLQVYPSLWLNPAKA